MEDRKMMRFVIDTNVFVSSLSSHSDSHWIILSLMNEEFELCISHEMLLEYEEVLKRKYSFSVADNFLRSIKDLPNVHFIDVYYQWDVLKDKDDNKFFDSAISGQADYLVTEDKDFNIAKKVVFPSLKIINIDSFKTILYEFIVK
jgi:uncharacterized protein